MQHHDALLLLQQWCQKLAELPSKFLLVLLTGTSLCHRCDDAHIHQRVSNSIIYLHFALARPMRCTFFQVFCECCQLLSAGS
jgi:hypothetical protein